MRAAFCFSSMTACIQQLKKMAPLGTQQVHFKEVHEGFLSSDALNDAKQTDISHRHVHFERVIKSGLNRLALTTKHDAYAESY